MKRIFLTLIVLASLFTAIAVADDSVAPKTTRKPSSLNYAPSEVGQFADGTTVNEVANYGMWVVQIKQPNGSICYAIAWNLGGSGMSCLQTSAGSSGQSTGQ